jgi:hypothetical protein
VGGGKVDTDGRITGGRGDEGEGLGWGGERGESHQGIYYFVMGS